MLPLAPAIVSLEPLGTALPLAAIVPFAALLACIAFLPLVAPHWWEHNKNRALVSALFAIPFAIYLGVAHGEAGRHALVEAVLDYVSFLALLGSLYVVSGGIYVRGSLAGSPVSNTTMLAIGAMLANLIGTTGASVVLIRPLLRANRTRERKTHIVLFFIFVVSNCGGMLTPLGDPPLYLGFLKGVPFEWTLGLWKQWLFVNAVLLGLFFLGDSIVLDREEESRPGAQLEDALKHERLGIEGKHNIFFLAMIVATIIARGASVGSRRGHWAFGVQELALLVLTVAAYTLTKPAVRSANSFRFAPIVEVAVLFAGIFVTMVAPLQILNARGSELGLTEPWQYFWATGLLSSFLDNAPTYLTFAATACGQAGVPVEGATYLTVFLGQSPENHAVLAAISCGAVLMGANTYIGNGPNFMVKAIAEENGVRMPSFFGYMLWTSLILLPIFALVTVFFFV